MLKNVNWNNARAFAKIKYLKKKTRHIRYYFFCSKFPFTVLYKGQKKQQAAPSRKPLLYLYIQEGPYTGRCYIRFFGVSCRRIDNLLFGPSLSIYIHQHTHTQKEECVCMCSLSSLRIAFARRCVCLNATDSYI